jgi:hypothetical protein
MLGIGSVGVKTEAALYLAGRQGATATGRHSRRVNKKWSHHPILTDFVAICQKPN